MAQTPMELVDEAWKEWASKPYNKRWVQMLEGTPIKNDLTCHIARKITQQKEG